jgi:hypothetical protein
MKYQDVTFKNQTVEVDGNDYKNCTFEKCMMRFRGDGEPGSMIGSRITDCQWHFDGPAGNTIQFLTALYANGGADFVDALVRVIKGKSRSASRTLH